MYCETRGETKTAVFGTNKSKMDCSTTPSPPPGMTYEDLALKSCIPNTSAEIGKLSLTPSPPQNSNHKHGPKTCHFRDIILLLHPKFISEYLEKVLDYLKSNISLICFPNLAPFKEEFLARIVQKENLRFIGLNKAFSDISRRILKVLDDNHDVYIWSYEYNTDNNMTMLFYRKIYLSKSFKEKEPKHINKNEPFEWPIDDTLVFAKLSQNQRNAGQLLLQLSYPCIASTMQMLVDFVEDCSGNILEFRDQTPEEARFIIMVSTLQEKNNITEILSKPLKKLANELTQAMERHYVTFKVKEGKIMKHRLRDVTLKKKHTDPKIYSSEVYDPKKIFLKSLHRKVDVGVQYKSDSARTDKNDNETKRANDSGNSDDKYKKSKGIQWQRAGEEVPKREDSPQRVRRCVRNAKLLEALSVPLDSEVAMRMMTKMGWKGGALGARGEGITEPILPALNIKAGAGLGSDHSPMRKHDRKQKNTEQDMKSSRNNPKSTRKSVPNRTKSIFRMELLGSVLEVLRKTDLGYLEMELFERLTKKELRFLMFIIKSFNNRTNIGLSASQEQDLVERISEIMLVKPGIMLEYAVSDDLRKYTITRKQTNNNNHTNQCQIDDLSIHELLDSFDSDAVRSSQINELADKLWSFKNNLRKRSIISMAHRMTFFKVILNFVKSDLQMTYVSFSERLKLRYCGFLKTVVKNINRREKANYGSSVENDLYADIKRCIDVYYLLFNFDRNLRYIKFEKVRLHRFLNYNRQDYCNDNSNTDRNRSDNSATDKNRSDNSDTDKNRSDNSDTDKNRSDKSDTDKNRSDNSDTDKNRSDNSDIDRNRCGKNPSDTESDSVVSFRNDINDNCRHDKNDGYTIMSSPMDIDLRDKIKCSQTNCNIDMAAMESSLKMSDSSMAAIISSSNSNEKDIAAMESSTKVEDDIIAAITATLQNSRTKMEEDVMAVIRSSIIKSVNDVAAIKALSKMGEEIIAAIRKPTDDIEAIKSSLKMSNDNAAIKSSLKMTNDNAAINLTSNMSCDVTNSSATDSDFDIDSPLSGKRSRTTSESSDVLAKKSKVNDFKCLRIYSGYGTVDSYIASNIQECISKDIENKQESLPLLKCLGLFDGCLKYRCDNDTTLLWLEKLLSKTYLGVQIFTRVEDYVKSTSNVKIAVKVRAYFKIEVETFLKTLQIYNSDLNVSDWVLVDFRLGSDCLIYVFEIDCQSFEFIEKFNYSLYAGIDKVDFSLVWD